MAFVLKENGECFRQKWWMFQTQENDQWCFWTEDKGKNLGQREMVNVLGKGRWHMFGAGKKNWMSYAENVAWQMEKVKVRGESKTNLTAGVQNENQNERRREWSTRQDKTICRTSQPSSKQQTDKQIMSDMKCFFWVSYLHSYSAG